METHVKEVQLNDLLAAGVHFGHLTRRWNPKMKKYIFMERNGIHVIDLNKTLKLVKEAQAAMIELVRSGESVLFVGTKKQARDIIKAAAEKCDMHYVTERWLGGTLTNFSTIKKSIKRMKNLEKKATDGTYDKINKKEILSIERELEKLDRVLGGIRDMNRLPGAALVVDPKKEAIAVAELRRLDIPVFAIVDTNCDPSMVDYIIPANDDAFKSIALIVEAMTDAILEGRSGRVEKEDQKEDEADQDDVKELIEDAVADDDDDSED
ncbi:MAG: 30S ribosomal protein S2 [Deferribacteres bacterium]|nr:30S ribosomal protein S2 [candidate division KSB1 bacterium]MCB9500378.1 30S ribosomal protein S2 [Deferribacteres bacterium]